MCTLVMVSTVPCHMNRLDVLASFRISAYPLAVSMLAITTVRSASDRIKFTVANIITFRRRCAHGANHGNRVFDSATKQD